MKEENKRHLLYLTFSWLILGLLGWIISLLWIQYGIPEIPRTDIWGKIPKPYVWRGFFSFWIPLLYAFFSLTYFILFQLKLRAGFKKALKQDLYTYFLILIFLILEFSWKETGDWYLWFGIFYLSLICIKAIILIKFLYRNIINTSQPLVLKKIKWAIFLSTLLVYLLLASWISSSISTTGDEPYYLLITHSFAKDHDLDLANNFQNRDYSLFCWGGRLWEGQNILTTEKGEMFSTAYNGLYPSLLLPGYVLGGRLGATFTNNIFAALLMLNLFLLCFEITKSHRASFYTWLCVAFTSPVLFFSSQIYPEILAGLLTIFTFRKIREIRYFSTSLKANLVLIGAVICILPWLKVRYAPIAGILFFLTIIQIKRFRFLIVILLIIAILGCLSFLFLDKFLFKGTMLHRFGTANIEEILSGQKSIIQTIWSRFKWNSHIIRGSLGLIFDQEFGLLFYTPIYSLAFVGLLLMIRENRRDIFMVLMIYIAYSYVVLSHFGRMWYAGWSLPSRYIVSIVPLLGILVAKSFQELRGKLFYWIATLLALWSFLISYLLTLKPIWRYNRVDSSTNLLELGGRSLSINLTRFLPSFSNVSSLTYQLTLLVILIIIGISLYFYIQNKKIWIKSFQTEMEKAIFVTLLVTIVIWGGLLIIWVGNKVPTHQLEGESMQHSTGIIYTGYPDRSVWVMKKKGSLWDDIISKGGITTFKIIAGGYSSDEVLPHIVVKLDNRRIGETDISSGKEQWERGAYLFRANLKPGKHLLNIYFVNGADNTKIKERRHLYIDKVVIEK
jgi:hypothetical protein